MESDLRMVMLGVKQLGYSAVKLSKKGILETKVNIINQISFLSFLSQKIKQTTTTNFFFFFLKGLEKINQLCIQIENLAKNLPFPGGKYDREGLKLSLGMEGKAQQEKEGEEIIFATDT